jgi:hypothetical protein
MDNVDNNKLSVDGLPVPARLIKLIDAGLWPCTKAEAQKQNLRSLIPKERIHLFAPEEDRIYFVSPPFSTIAKRSRGGEGKFWSTFAALEGVSPELSVFLGDFGLGSDAPILLDYRDSHSTPSVIRLKWRKSEPNIWVRCAESFDQFADMLGLDAG